jgi:hypothetical protein
MKVVCQKAEGTCFLGQEKSADRGIHSTRDHKNIISVLQNIKKKNYIGPLRTKCVEY